MLFVSIYLIQMENTVQIICSVYVANVIFLVQTGLVNHIFLGILQILFQGVVYSDRTILKYRWEEPFERPFGKSYINTDVWQHLYLSA